MSLFYHYARCPRTPTGWRLWIISTRACLRPECHLTHLPSRYTSGNMSRVSYPIPGTSLIPAVAGINVKPFVNATAGSSSTIGRYDPYAPPRRPATTATAAPPTSSSSPPSELLFFHIIAVTAHIRPIAIRFKPSPFIRVERAVSSVVECPGMFIFPLVWYVI